VTLAYTHSVERSLVEDVFQLGWRGDLIHRRTITRSMGAGLPEGGEARGGVMTTRGTGERHREIALRYGAENEPFIVVGDTRRDLSDVADGRALELRVRQVWETLLGR
jgi:hypothetical protein